MIDHGTREHAQWSASATARNVQCPGALTLARFAPPQKESIHAARGTAAHQAAEKCLRTGCAPSDLLGGIEATKEHSIVLDEELIASAEAYVDYVRERGGDLQIEQRFSLDSLRPPFEAGGTADAVIYHAATRTLQVVDLKNGQGIVDVKGNPQLRTYGLGALLANPKLKVETVTVTIVQPRAPHKDGRIRSETFHVTDLIDWTADLLDSMHRAKQAMDAYDAAAGNSVLLDDWAEQWLKPGKCTFCPVEGQCPALRKQALAVANLWVDDAGAPRIGNIPGEMSPETLGATLDMLPMLEDWVKAVRAYAHSLAEGGVEIPGYQLVEKIGNRAFIEGQIGELIADLRDAGIALDDMYSEPKLKSPAQMEKLLGAKRKALLNPYVHRPVNGTNLVSTAKTSRPAAAPAATAFLEK